MELHQRNPILNLPPSLWDREGRASNRKVEQETSENTATIVLAIVPRYRNDSASQTLGQSPFVFSSLRASFGMIYMPPSSDIWKGFTRNRTFSRVAPILWIPSLGKLLHKMLKAMGLFSALFQVLGKDLTF